jgi:hypothetical protein
VTIAIEVTFMPSPPLVEDRKTRLEATRLLLCCLYRTRVLAPPRLLTYALFSVLSLEESTGYY